MLLQVVYGCWGCWVFAKSEKRDWGRPEGSGKHEAHFAGRRARHKVREGDGFPGGITELRPFDTGLLQRPRTWICSNLSVRTKVINYHRLTLPGQVRTG